jgi:hypothetical protein
VYNKNDEDYGINISKDLTFIGKGNNVVIDAGGQGRILSIANNLNVTFINIKFINAKSLEGSAIYNPYEGTILTIINSTFTNNSATGVNGGAIYNSAPNFIIIGSNFTDNSAFSAGGAIFNSVSGVNFNVIDSNFINNKAVNGGAIFNRALNFTVSNSNFTNNEAATDNQNSGVGAAIFNEIGANFRVINSSFNNNNADAIGGAIVNWGGANFTVIGSNFTANTATTYASAIFNNVGSNFKVISSNFNSNTVSNNGGAIYNNGANFIINSSNFTANNANLGGAIYNTGTNFNVNGSIFTSNNATNGGAITNNGTNTNFIVIGSTFTRNNASNIGGAIYNSGRMNVSTNTMSGNDAILGKMIYNDGSMGILNLTYLNNQTKPVNLGKNIIIFAYLTDDMGNTVTGQNISFDVKGTLIGNTTSIEGYANLNYTPLNLGLVPVLGDYEGHVNYPINILQGELLIKIATSSTIIVKDPVKIGDNIVISGVLTDDSGNTLNNTLVNVTVGGVTYNISTNKNGTWFLNYTPTHLGSVNVSIEYNGNETYFPCTNSSKFNVIDDPISPVDPTKPINPDDYLPSHTTMKQTGIPIIAIILILLSAIGIFDRKQK